MAAKMNRWLLVSYFTRGTPYARLADRFMTSARIAGIENVDVCAATNFRSWNKNTRIKARLIRRKMEECEGAFDSIVFVDIDAVIHHYPKLFDTFHADIGAHFRNWRHAKNELLSGTLFFKINDRTLRVVNDWIKLNNQDQTIYEQKNLSRAIRRQSHLLTVKSLPIEYCMIFDDEHRDKRDPVIEHFQASRKLRHEVSR